CQPQHLIEIGPGSGSDGGTVAATGTAPELSDNPESLIGRYLSGRNKGKVRTGATEVQMIEDGLISLTTATSHTVHALDIAIPRNRLTVVTGVSGSGKSSLVLDSLVPALQNDERFRPDHTLAVDPNGIEHGNVVDATPIGINVRSTVATYSGVLDDLRRNYARLDSAKSDGLSAGDFSYNTGSLRCPRCQGTGEITLDVQ